MPPLFDPKTFTREQLNQLNNQPGKSLAETNDAATLLKAGANKDVVAAARPKAEVDAALVAMGDGTKGDITSVSEAIDTGMTASFLGNTEKSLEALNKQLGDRIEAGRAASEEGIKTQAAITREEIEQNQAEGNRQIGYAAERLGGSVVLRRNIEDFTAGVSKFHADIDRSLERLDIEMNTALATNNNNAWTQMFNLQKELYQTKLDMYDRAVDVYFKNATLALQEHEMANQRLDTMLQYASLDNASEEELANIAKATGFSVDQLRAMGATAQQSFNAAMTAKLGTNITYPAALVPWQGSIDKALEGGAGYEDAVQQAVTDANDRGVKLSDADISSLSQYAKEQYDQATAAAAELKAAETGAGAGKKISQYDAAGNLKSGTFNSGGAPVATDVDILANSLFGAFTVDESGNVKRK